MRSSANHETLVFADDDYILITQAIAAASSSSGDRELRDSLPSNREPLSNTLEQSCLQNKDLASSKTDQDGNSRGRTRTIIAQLSYGTYDRKSSHHWIRRRRIPQWHQKFGTPSIQNLSMPNAYQALCLLNPRRTHLLLKPSLSPGTHQKTKKPAANPNPKMMISKSKRWIISLIPPSLHREGARESPTQDLLQTERKKKACYNNIKNPISHLVPGTPIHGSESRKKKHSVHSETPHLQKRNSKSGKKAAKMPQNKRKKQRKTQKTHNRTNKHTHTHTHTHAGSEA
jgi:hypothetical protein